jgi:multimeric flavodoxin WrbA
MAKTVVIISSPRNANSKEIAMKMADGAKSKGNEIEVFELNKLKDARGCQSCFGCKKTGKCILKDGQTPILDAIRAADSIIISTPTYFGHATAQYRLLEDRFFGFLGGDFTPNIAAGKKVAVAVTCGSGLDGAEQIAKDIEGVWSGFLKGIVVGDVVVGDMMAPDAAAKNADVMAKAFSIGEKL